MGFFGSPVNMALDIFSGFDDHNFVFMDFFYLVWLGVFVVVLSLVSSLWVSNGSLLSFFTLILSVVEELVFRSSSKGVGGSMGVFGSLFLFLLGLNIIGLVPYVFSLTSHLSINLSVALPLWLSIVLMGIFYDLGSFLAHFQPMGSPAALNPFLCLIELVSSLVRPITLSVRLTANLSTGHILIGLLGLGFVKRSMLVIGLVLVIGLFYFIFEIGVCFVQGYIFTLLPTLYLDEHPSDSHH